MTFLSTNIASVSNPKIIGSMTEFLGFKESYRIDNAVSTFLGTLNFVGAIVGRGIEIVKYTGAMNPLFGQLDKINEITGQFDYTLATIGGHRIVIEYAGNFSGTDKVNMIIGQNQNIPYTAPVFGVAPTIQSVVYEGEVATVTAGSGGTAVWSYYQWQSFDGLVWSNIAGANSNTYTPPRSPNAVTGFLNIRCQVTPMDALGNNGTTIVLTPIAYRKVSNVNRVTANWQDGTGVTVRSNGTKSTDGLSTTVTVNTADTQCWIAGTISPAFVAAESFRAFTTIKAQKNGANGNVALLIAGGGTFVGSPVIACTSSFVVDVRTITVNTIGGSGAVRMEYNISPVVIVGDYITISLDELYQILT